jgi:hypothetical protein
VIDDVERRQLTAADRSGLFQRAEVMYLGHVTER